MRHKLLRVGPGGQRWLFALAVVALVAVACRHEAGRTVLVEADTTAMTSDEGLTQTPPSTASTPDEVVIVEREVAPETAVNTIDSPTATPDVKDPEEADAEAPTPADPPTSIPAGTRIDLVLKTPLHTATTLVGDRFAARLDEPVHMGDAIVIAEGALVEGRVDQVVSAEETTDEYPSAMIHLRFDTVRLPSGERLPIAAEVTGSEPDPTKELEPERPGGSRIAGVARGALTGALLGRIFGGSGRSTVLGAVIGSAAGAAIVAPTPDREVIVPSGTPISIVLKESLEIPRAPDGAAL